MFGHNSIDPEPIRPEAAPALLPALGLVAGTCAGPHLAFLPVTALAALVVLGLALARRAGVAVAALALGLASGALRADVEPRVDPERPVEVVTVVAGHPVRHDEETFLPTRVRTWSQGRAVARGAFYLQVTLPPGPAPPGIGTVVRLRGYLRRSAGFANLPPRGPGPWRLRLKSARFLTVEAPPEGMTALAAAVRRRAEAALEAAPRGGGRALVRALALGDRSRLPKAWRQALQRSGLGHLLAVSGLHVGLLAALLLLAAAALPPRVKYLPAVAGLAAYLLLIGPQPAALRASLMGLMALGALALHRPPQGVNALACCAGALALWDPAITQRLGFQLSAAATAGILILAPRFAARWTALPPALRKPLGVTVAAQLATLPWTLPLEGGVHPAAPLLNLVAIPYLAVCLLVSLGWLALALTWGTAAAAAVPLLDALAGALEHLARLPPSPAFFLPLQLPAAWAPAVAAAAVAAGLRPAAAARCALLAGLLALGGNRVEAPAVPEAVALDVGQGDALLLRDGRRAVLVDGGGWPHGDLGGRVLVPALAALGVRRLDALVLTHPDQDHCAGLVDLARYLPVDEIWMGPGWLDDACASELLAGARRWRVLWRGEVERLGRWRLEVLHPAAGRRHGRNDRSLVLVARTGDHRLLLAGDVSAEVERRLARELGPALAADVLKVAHHGSKSSTCAPLLDAVRPRLALVSAGAANPYGHPHPTVLERLEAAGARVLRTDRSGMVRLRFHPAAITVELPGAPR